MKTHPNQTAFETVPDKVSSTTFFYPDPQTVHGRVLGAFLRGERHSTLTARPRFHTTTLTQAVQKLRRAGWQVRTESMAVETGDTGRVATIGIYSLTHDVIAAAGERGKHFADECAEVELLREVA